MNLLLQILPILLINIIFEVNSQSVCQFSSAQDKNTLIGTSFIENSGSNLCFELQPPTSGKNGLVLVKLDTCLWDKKKPPNNLQFRIRNGNGGNVISPEVKAFVDTCLSPSSNGFGSPVTELGSVNCQPRDRSQNWTFVKVNNGFGSGPGFGFGFGQNNKETYQIKNSATGKCLRAVKNVVGASVQESPCNSRDGLQTWRICSTTNNLN